MARRKAPRRGEEYPARGLEDLEDPASRFDLEVTPAERGDQYEDLIHTGLTDSRVPRPRFFPARPSPWLRSRATIRSRTVGRRLDEVLKVPSLLDRSLACAGRSIRREVLFALRKTGKGSGARRRVYRYNSKWRC